MAEEVDWYALLGCGIESSKEDISKATRKLSLKYHPDKNPDPKAADMFLLIQKAKNFLLDDEKRMEFDEVIRKTLKRKEYDNDRNRNMDDRRKKMREDLEARVQSVKTTTYTAPDSAASKEEIKLKSKRYQEATLERLRKENNIRMEASSFEALQKAQKQEEDMLNHRRSLAEESLNKSGINKEDTETQFTIKIKWKRTRESHSDETLHKLFSIYGTIEEICFIGEKGNAAIITFTNKISAISAVDAYATSEDVRVTHLSKSLRSDDKKPAIFTHQYYATGSYTSENKLEDSDLRGHIKRAVEKEELLRRMLNKNSQSSYSTANVAVNEMRTNETTSTSTSTSYPTNSTIPPINPFSSRNTNTSAPPVSAASLALKESDILARMMEAAAAATRAKNLNNSFPT